MKNHIYSVTINDYNVRDQIYFDTWVTHHVYSFLRLATEIFECVRTNAISGAGEHYINITRNIAV